MKSVLLLPIALLALPVAGCGDSGRPRPQGPDPSQAISRTEGAQVLDEAPPKPEIAPPPAGHAQYICDVQNPEGKPVGGADLRVLTAMPEGGYMRVPRRRDVEATYPSPRHGRVFFNIPADGQPRWLWVGGLGIQPFLVDLQPPADGAVHHHKVTVQPVPLCRMVIQDHEGNLVYNAIVSMTPPDAKSNEGWTERSDELGEVSFTRPYGTYHFIASKANGTCRYTDATFEWKGQQTPIVIQLPEKTPGS